ncbi:MAG: hypothetical protein R2708_15320 [Vicinamibacterales bacterium]
MTQLEIEREAPRKETDKARRSASRSSRRSWPTSREEQRRLTAHWTQEKESIHKPPA